MPQLAPLSWVFLSFFLFSIVFFSFCGCWWVKKSPLFLGSFSKKSLSSFIWCW